MTAAPVRHLGCPSCGATLARREDERTVRCSACGNRCVLTGVEAIPRFQVVPAVGRERATAIVRAALAKWPVRAGTAERAAIVAADLVWVPFYEFEAVQAGFVRHTKQVQSVRGGRVDWSEGRRRFVDPQGREISEAEYYRRRDVGVVDTTVVLRSHHVTGAAAGADGWRLEEIDLDRILSAPSVRVVPFGSPDAPQGHVLPPRRGRTDAEEDVRRVAATHADASEMSFLAPELRYVFTAVWVVRYRVDRHPYTFVVDATDGRVLTGRAPEAPRRGALFLVLAGAYVGFPLGKILATAADDGTRSVGTLAAIVARFCFSSPILLAFVPLVLLVPLAAAWGEFRFRGEVVFTPDGATVEKLARPARTFLERVVDWIVRSIDEFAMAQVER